MGFIPLSTGRRSIGDGPFKRFAVLRSQGPEKFPELVQNGAFTSDLSGWTDASENTGYSAFSSGRAALYNDGGSSSNEGIIYQEIETIIGKTYTLRVAIQGVGAIVQVGSNPLSNSISQSDNLTVDYEHTFTATGTNVAITIRNFDRAGITYIDNVSLRQSGIRIPAINVLYTTATASPNDRESADITRLAGEFVTELVMLDSSEYPGASIETCDFVAGTIPPEYSAIPIYDQSSYGKIIYFTAGATPTALEQAAIDKIKVYNFDVVERGTSLGLSGDYDYRYGTVPIGNMSIPKLVRVPTASLSSAGDGVTDDTSSITGWLVANPTEQLVLDPTKTYFIGSTFFLNVDFDLDLNGATLLLSDDSVIVGYNRSFLSRTGSPYASVALGETDIVLASGNDYSSLSVGDVINILSDDIFEAVGSYRHGQTTKIMAINGNTITVSPPVNDTYDIDQIIRYRPLKQRIRNGVIDARRTPAHTAGEAKIVVRLDGQDPLIENVDLIGNEFISRGFFTHGMEPIFSNSSATGITNDLGIIGSSGRTGYGFSFYGDNCLAYACKATNCKHGLESAGNRKSTTRLVTYDQCTNATPVGEQNTMVFEGQSNEQPKYQGADIHGGGRTAVIQNCDFSGVNMLLDVRCRNTAIDNVALTHNGSNSRYAGNLLINIREAASSVTVNNLSVSKGTVEGATVDASIFGIQSFAATNDIDLTVTNVDNSSSEISLFKLPYQSATEATNVDIGDLSFTDIRGTYNKGIVIDGDATYPFHSVDSIIFDTGSVDVSFVDSVVVQVNNLQAFGGVTASGIVNGSAVDSSNVSVVGVSP